MSTLAVQMCAAIVFLLCYLYLRIHRSINYPGLVPSMGKPGILGYISTAVRYTLDTETVLREGRARFPKQPFVVPTLSGPVFLLGPEFLHRVRSSTDEVLNQPMSVNEGLQLPYTMDEHQLENPYQASVMRTDANRTLPSYIPELLEESDLAMEETFRRFKTDAGYVEIPVFDTMTHLVARISNRVILGLELCRNEDYLRAVVRFAEMIPATAPFVTWTPRILRPIAYLLCSSVLGGKKEPLRYIIPYLQRHFEKPKPLSEATTLVVEHLINNAPPHETPQSLAIRVLNLNFGSIHTSSIFITQALFEIAILDPEDIESIRKEVQEALKSEGGWTKGALLKFTKIDSALREVGRVYGLMYFALARHTMVQFDLGNGLVVPPGHQVAIDMKAVHYDPSVYPDPERCDLFRFSKLREGVGLGSKFGFTTVDGDYLPFGAGRHACAGRFFAATELKIMLAHILLNYDVSLPEGSRTRPKNLTFNGAVIPDPKGKIVLRPRTSTQ